MESSAAAGPLWKSYVCQIWKTTQHGYQLDDILESPAEALDFLQGIANAVAFGRGYWRDSIALTLTDPMLEIESAIRNHKSVKWWFEAIGSERIVVDNPVPEWFLTPPVAWWIEPHEYPAICQEVGISGRVIRDYCADPHSGPPANSQPLPDSYRDARRYIINTADDWVSLVERYQSQRRVRRTYEFELFDELSIPKWTDVAIDFDIVTLSVGGFTQAAYLPLKTRAGRSTMLCGWNPGESILLRGDK